MKTLMIVAFRNLNRQKKRTFLLGGAVAFGILIVTVINGFSGAFSRNVAENMAHLFAGHVFVEASEKTPKGKTLDLIRDDSAVLEALAAAGIPADYVAKRSSMNVTLVFEGNKTSQNIFGTDLEGEKYLKERLSFKDGGFELTKTEPRALILSEGVAKKLNAHIGDTILAQLKTVTGQNNVGEFVLAGITQDMGLFSNMLAYAHREYFNQLIDIGPEEYQLFGIMTADLAKSELVAARLNAALKERAPVFELPPVVPAPKKAAKSDKLKSATGNTDTAKIEAAKTDGASTVASETVAAASDSSSPMGSRYRKLLRLSRKETWEGSKYRVFTINDMISQIEELVGVLNGVSLGILITLFLIIMVGIANTFRMIMYERVKEIGTMRALGMHRGSVRTLFLMEAGLLSAAGALAGMLVAALVMLGLSIPDFGTGTFFALLMKNGHLSFSPPLVQSIVNLLLVVAMTALAAYLPARSAARLEPAAALRTSK